MYYEPEHARRCAAGEAFEALTREAEHLKDWVKQTYGELDGATVSTIANNIGKVHAAWKQSRSNAGEPKPAKIKKSPAPTAPPQ
jgi:hypothetical protein